MNIINKTQQYNQKYTWVIERMPGLLHSIHFPAVAVMFDLAEKNLDWQVIYITIKNEQIELLFPIEKLCEHGQTFFAKELQCDGNYENIINEWRNTETEFNQFCSQISNLSSLTDEQLYQLYDNFQKIYRQIWALPLTATAISYYADTWITQTIRNEKLQKFSFLITPDESSFTQQEELDLLKINNEDQLQEHVQKYFWINNNYLNAKPLTIAYFKQRLQEIKNPQHFLLQKQQQHSELLRKKEQLRQDFSPEERTIAELINLATTFQDLRKKYNLIGNHYLNLFFRRNKAALSSTKSNPPNVFPGIFRTFENR